MQVCMYVKANASEYINAISKIRQSTINTTTQMFAGMQGQLNALLH